MSKLPHPPADEQPVPAATDNIPSPDVSPVEMFEFLNESDTPSPTAAMARGRGVRSDFWALVGCNAVVFIGSVCIMVLELTASRLIAHHVGQSLYTWTSVIGIMLAGITLGNFIGGWTADRFADRRRTLAWLFLIASLLSASVLILDRIAGSFERSKDIPWPLWVVWIVGFIFLAPAVALGTISPVAASLALSRSQKTGITVGNVYAWGALGSIVGTFLTGFWLIDLFGLQAIVGVTAITLAIVGACVASQQWVFRTGVVLGWLQMLVFVSLAAAVGPDAGARVGRAVGIVISLPADRESRWNDIDEWTTYGHNIGRDLQRLGLSLGLRNDEPGAYHDESNYSYIYVGDQTADNGDPIKYLKLDTLTHSYFNPSDPTALYYEYEQVYAAVTERAAEQWQRETIVELEPFEGRESLLKKLPKWVRSRPTAKDSVKLQLTGAMSATRHDELLTLSPQGKYWLALQDLFRQSNRKDFGGWVGINLDQLPDTVTLGEEFKEIVRYDPVLRTLNAYAVVDEATFERLVNKAPQAAYYRGVNQLYEDSRQVSTFFIGGGGFIFPRWIEERFPKQPRIDVAELDPAVKRAVQLEMGLAPDGETAVNTLLGDARRVVDAQLLLNIQRKTKQQSPVLYDFVYGDAFNDFSVPWHLTTIEFSEKIKQLLHPERGVYLVNVIDIYARSEYPNDDEHKHQGIRFTGQLPAPLPPDWSGLSDWQPCAAPFSGLELREHHEEGDVLFGYRGRMSQSKQQQLVALAPGNSQFVEFIGRLAERSRTVRSGRFLGRYVNSMIDVFPNVYVFSSNKGDVPAATRDTLVIVAAMQPLNLKELRYGKYWDDWYGQPFAWSETDPKTGQRTTHGQLDSVVTLAEGKTLTDNFAPVDNLLIPVFLDKD